MGDNFFLKSLKSGWGKILGKNGFHFGLLLMDLDKNPKILAFLAFLTWG